MILRNNMIGKILVYKFREIKGKNTVTKASCVVFKSCLYIVLKQGRIQRFWKGGALYVGQHGWPGRKMLGFRWPKKAKITLEFGKIFLSVFSNFLHFNRQNLINFSKITNALIRKEKKQSYSSQ